MRSICLCKKSSLPGKDDTYEIIVEDKFQILLHKFYSSFKIFQYLAIINCAAVNIGVHRFFGLVFQGS